MAPFDVHGNPEAAERKTTLYLAEVQNDHINVMGTRVVTPLRREAASGPHARNLHPAFQVGNDQVVLDTAALAAGPLAELRKCVGSLRESRLKIQEALDTLFASF